MRSFSEKKIRHKLSIAVPKDTRLEIDAARGVTVVRGLEGDLSADVNGGALSLVEHRGAVKIEIDEGQVELKDHRGAARPVEIKGDEGNVSVSLAGGESGPGVIQLDNGRIDFSLSPKTRTAVQAIVTEEGTVESEGFPITRPDPQALYVHAHQGKYLWQLSLKKGTVRVGLPEIK
ncbi:MAG: hypothetical protein M5R36_19990 [Deltaproteobacteria bacterium]|nr:hypothetical protein [Deltaproteobacteria bacterium]